MNTEDFNCNGRSTCRDAWHKCLNMPGNLVSLFACLCGARKKKPLRELQQVETEPRNQAVIADKTTTYPGNGQPQHCENSELQALLQLQRVLGGLRGTWLPRTHAILSAITVFLYADEISFYGASGSSKAGLPVCFVRLAREFGDSSEGLKDGKTSPMAGFEVWPANERTKLEGQGRMDDCKIPDEASLQLTRRQACQRLMPAMLDRMLASQAPVIQSLKSRSFEPALSPDGPGVTEGRPTTLVGNSTVGSIQDVVALVPLATGNHIAGALWIVQYGRHQGDDRTGVPTQQVGGKATANTPVNNSAPVSHGNGVAAADATADMVRATGLQSPPPCPDLISSPRALQQLSLTASMCLLGHKITFLSSLSDSLRQLSASSSMQQLVGILCDVLTAHMRERFLLEPRVFAALVPEATSAVGLMFNRSLSAAPPRSAAKPARGGAGSQETVAASEARRDGPRPQSPRAAMVFGRESRSLGSRPISDNVSPHLAQTANAASTAAALASAGGSIDRDGSIFPRTMRGQGIPRVVALTQSDLAVLDASVGHGGGGSTVATSGSFMALRVKPFPLAQTLLRHVVKKVAAAAAASGHISSDSTIGCCLGGQSGSCTCAEVVEDCAVHVQDPKKPSRDVLLLIANSGAGAVMPNPLWSGFGGTASSGTMPFGGSGTSVSGSFTSGRRLVSSLVLLVLPAGDGKAMIGLYVAFPQTLPLHLLQRARCNMLEILEVMYSKVALKLTTDLAMELETLATAAPGSYALVEAPEVDDCAVNAGSAATATMDDGTGLQASKSKLLLQSPIDAESTPDRMVPMYSPIVQSFLYDSRSAIGGPNSGMVPGGAGNSALGATRSMNLMDTIATPHACDNTVGVTSLLSARESALAVSNVPNCMTTGCEGLTHSTVIHMEELDMVQSTMRAQMPLLVASMQNSISNARMEATLAAAASCLNKSGVSLSTSGAATFSADHNELSQLELHSQLGHGGCAVVFKGTMATLDCAIKLMEMPDVDGVDATGSIKADPNLEWVENGNGGGSGGADGSLLDSDRLAAHRALLRNAMELAAMTSISHPNIMQVYSTFSNVTLGRRVKADGADHFYLMSVDGSASTHPDAPPVCVAIVCEWCDKGCLGSALQKRTFPALLPQSSVARRPPYHNWPQGSGGSGKQGRVLDFKGILMTLLDVAMALRHLHMHNLIHRDVKPANVLLKSNMMDPRGFTAKLADFGFVTLLNEPGDEKSGGEPFVWVDESCGTVTHMAPECWQKPARLGASCDIYSFGILMWELTAGGSRPYPEVTPNNIAAVVKKGVRPMFDDSVPAQYRFLAQRCWTAEPTSRPRTSELVTAISRMLNRI